MSWGYYFTSSCYQTTTTRWRAANQQDGFVVQGCSGQNGNQCTRKQRGPYQTTIKQLQYVSDDIAVDWRARVDVLHVITRCPPFLPANTTTKMSSSRTSAINVSFHASPCTILATLTHAQRVRVRQRHLTTFSFHRQVYAIRSSDSVETRKFDTTEKDVLKSK